MEVGWLGPATIVGLAGGTLVGMTGVGAGSVIAAGLLLTFPDIAAQKIVGSATLQAVGMKLAGVLARRQFRFGEGRLGLAMAAGAIPLAVTGAWTSARIGSGALRPVMAIVLLVVGLLLIAQAVPRGGVARAMVDPGVEPKRVHVSLVGALVGFVAGLTSIGTGTLFVSALVGPLRIEPHRAVAVALLAGLLTLIVSGMTHAMLGHVDLALVVGTLLGSVPGVLIGTYLAQRLSGLMLRGTIGAGIAVAAIVALARLRG